MFRMTNARSNQLVELEAKVLFSRIEGVRRKYDQLTLERTSRHVLSAELDRSCTRSTRRARCSG